MNNIHLHRYIALYDKPGDAFVDKVALSLEEFETVRRLLGYEEREPMFDCYPLKGDVLSKVLTLLEGRLRTGDYDYFLETESI